MKCPHCGKEAQHPDPVYAPSEYYCYHCKWFGYKEDE